LESSEEFQETKVKPLQTVKAKISAVLKDYDIPEEAVEAILSCKTIKERNKFLSDNFYNDTAAIMQVSALADQAKDLQKGIEDARKEPESALQRLLKEGKTAQERRTQSVRREVASRASSAWNKALEQVQSSGKHPYLTPRDNDSTHNERITPLLKSAAGEFGKLVTKLADGGLSDLSDEVAELLATAVLFSHDSAANAELASSAIEGFNEVTASAERTYNQVRPRMGMSTGTPSVRTPAPPQSDTNNKDNIVKNRVREFTQNTILPGLRNSGNR
jgi:hypothetical protein